MTGEDIFGIIAIMGIVGWIPIWFFFNGIVKVIRAFKGLMMTDMIGIRE